jgi:hypothetical protein
LLRAILSGWARCDLVSVSLREEGMEKSELFPVDQEDIDAFWRDGAVVLRGVLNEHWRRELADGITLNLAQPTSRRVDWVRDETTGDHLFHDQLTVAHNPHYERCMLASPLGPLAARFMASPTALAFYATVFVRSPGTRSRTPWHQDQTYWCADGRQALSIWTALDPVPAGTELEFVRGSHLWEKPLAQTNFDEQNLGGEREIEDIDFMLGRRPRPLRVPALAHGTRRRAGLPRHDRARRFGRPAGRAAAALDLDPVAGSRRPRHRPPRRLQPRLASRTGAERHRPWRLSGLRHVSHDHGRGYDPSLTGKRRPQARFPEIPERLR